MAEYWTEVEDWLLYPRREAPHEPKLRMSDEEAHVRLKALGEALTVKGFGSREPSNG